MTEKRIGWAGWYAWGFRTGSWYWNGLGISLSTHRLIGWYLYCIPIWTIEVKNIEKVCLTGFDLRLMALGIRVYYRNGDKLDQLTFGILGRRRKALELFKKANVPTFETDTTPQWKQDAS